MKSVHWRLGGGLGVALLIVSVSAPGVAQTEIIDPWTRPPTNQNEGLQEAGRTEQTGSGEVGERQVTRNAQFSQNPLGRVSSRIENRVQNRIRNRIDRTYDPTANATAPFETAEMRAERTEPR